MGRNPKHTHKAFFSKAPIIIIIMSQADLMLLSSAPQSIKENHSTAGTFHIIICSHGLFLPPVIHPVSQFKFQCATTVLTVQDWHQPTHCVEMST